MALIQSQQHQGSTVWRIGSPFISQNNLNHNNGIQTCFGIPKVCDVDMDDIKGVIYLCNVVSIEMPAAYKREMKTKEFTPA